jgi:polysaccharide export outer membrane protein
LRSIYLIFLPIFLLLFSTLAQAQNFAGHKTTSPAKVSPASSSNNVDVPTDASNATATVAPTPHRDFDSSSSMQEMRGRRYAGGLAGKYTLGPSDIIDVLVARHPEVGGRYTLNTEGKIQLEFVGDVSLSGLTKEGAADLLTKHLAKYIIKPEVIVKIFEYNSKVVYIVGEVGTPGKVFMRGDTITVREALLNAGLPQLTAATEAAILFTPSEDGKVVSKKVNVFELLYKGDLRQNYVMRPGDSLYLPPTLWAKVARFLNPVTQPIGQAAGSAAAIGAL